MSLAKRIAEARAETAAKLEKALRFSPDLQKPAQINFYTAHIAYLDKLAAGEPCAAPRADTANWDVTQAVLDARREASQPDPSQPTTDLLGEMGSRYTQNDKLRWAWSGNDTSEYVPPTALEAQRAVSRKIDQMEDEQYNRDLQRFEEMHADDEIDESDYSP